MEEPALFSTYSYTFRCTAPGLSHSWQSSHAPTLWPQRGIGIHFSRNTRDVEQIGCCEHEELTTVASRLSFGKKQEAPSIIYRTQWPIVPTNFPSEYLRNTRGSRQNVCFLTQYKNTMCATEAWWTNIINE